MTYRPIPHITCQDCGRVPAEAGQMYLDADGRARLVCWACRRKHEQQRKGR